MSFLSRLFPQVRQMQRDTLRIKSEREEWRQRYVSLEARARLGNSPRKWQYEGDGLATIHQAGFREDAGFRRAYAAGGEAPREEQQGEWQVRVGLWGAEQARNVPGVFVEVGDAAGFLTRAIIEHLGTDAHTKQFHVLEIADAAGLNGHGLGESDALPKIRKVRGSLTGALAAVDAASIAFLTIALGSAEQEIETGEHFWSRLAVGGVVLLNHYGLAEKEPHARSWEKFSHRHGIALLPLPTGQGVMVKTRI